MKVVPAVLADNENDFLLLMRQAESFTDYVQIDLMDGYFVPSKSFSGNKVNSLKTTLSFELHLMVKHPSEYMSTISNPNLKKVIFHYESEVNHINFINILKENGISPGLAINPETKINEFYDITRYVETLLFMTVTPGHYGSTFRSEVIDKISDSRKKFKKHIISVDGGVSLDNLHIFYNIGVDYVCVGSRIFLDNNPGKSYKTFLEKISELEKIK